MLLEKRTDFKNCSREKKAAIANTKIFAGKSYDLVSFASQQPDATVFIPSESETKAGMLKYEIIILIIYVSEMLSPLQNISLLNVCCVPLYFFLGLVLVVNN
jgi:hypothetical protein